METYDQESVLYITQLHDGLYVLDLKRTTTVSSGFHVPFARGVILISRVLSFSSMS